MASFQLWPADPLEKVFQDDAPSTTTGDELVLVGVRNGTTTAQVAITAGEEDLSVRLTSEGLVGEAATIPLTIRTVDTVPVVRNTPETPPTELVGTAPDSFPDPLQETASQEVPAEESGAFWITIDIPEETSPGTYTGEVTATSASTQQSLELALKVRAVTLPETTTLSMINWIGLDRIANMHGTSKWSPSFWDVLGRYASNLAAHGDSVIEAPLFDLIRISTDEQGELQFGFDRFDRYVSLFQEAGVNERILGKRLARRPPRTFRDDEAAQQSWDATELESYPFAVLTASGEVAYVQDTMCVSNPAFASFLAEFLPALQAHLRSRGWLEAFMLSIADEPNDQIAESYNRVGSLVREHAPEITTMEPTSTHNIVDSLDAWVPRLDEFNNHIEFYRERQALGEEVWFYTCLAPRGQYPNRFIDFSLLKVRILSWIAFKYDLDGFLHWGYNKWTPSPFEDVENVASHPEPLPPGDAFVVYPGADGPIDSLRWEATRAGIEDHALLSELEATTDRSTAMIYCDEVVTSPTEYLNDPVAFREVRRRVIDRLASES